VTAKRPLFSSTSQQFPRKWLSAPENAGLLQSMCRPSFAIADYFRAPTLVGPSAYGAHLYVKRVILLHNWTRRGTEQMRRGSNTKTEIHN
jgi:hypothetical protein